MKTRKIQLGHVVATPNALRALESGDHRPFFSNAIRAVTGAMFAKMIGKVTTSRLLMARGFCRRIQLDSARRSGSSPKLRGTMATAQLQRSCYRLTTDSYLM